MLMLESGSQKYKVEVVAGSGRAAREDGRPDECSFLAPKGIAVDEAYHSCFFAEWSGHTIRRVSFVMDCWRQKYAILLSLPLSSPSSPSSSAPSPCILSTSSARLLMLLIGRPDLHHDFTYVAARSTHQTNATSINTWKHFANCKLYH